MQHNYLQHSDCNIPNCSICDGTVKICITCGGTHVEGKGNSLTTTCCGEQLSQDKLKQIANGDIDYVGGRWLNKKLGPTITKRLVELGKQIVVGTTLLGHKKDKYICIGHYPNSRKEIVYCFHEIVGSENKYDSSFISVIHWKKFEELFKEIV